MSGDWYHVTVRDKDNIASFFLMEMKSCEWYIVPSAAVPNCIMDLQKELSKVILEQTVY
jgi:hypothetical protein